MMLRLGIPLFIAATEAVAQGDSSDPPLPLPPITAPTAALAKFASVAFTEVFFHPYGNENLPAIINEHISPNFTLTCAPSCSIRLSIPVHGNCIQNRSVSSRRRPGTNYLSMNNK